MHGLLIDFAVELETWLSYLGDPSTTKKLGGRIIQIKLYSNSKAKKNIGN